MSDQVYKIAKVQNRDDWTSKYGPMKSYALQLQGVDGWVELSQKPDTPAPVEGEDIFGHTEVQTHGDKTYLKFRKANPQYAPTALSGGSISKEDVSYIVMMLEELTGRRTKPDRPTPREDVVLEDIDDKPIELSEIPF